MNKNLLVALFCFLSLGFFAACSKKCQECTPCNNDCEWVEEEECKTVQKI